MISRRASNSVKMQAKLLRVLQTSHRQYPAPHAFPDPVPTPLTAPSPGIISPLPSRWFSVRTPGLDLCTYVINITITGNKYKVEQLSSFKNITVEFNLGEQYEADPGTGKNTYITTVDGAKMITKVASTGKTAAVREFNDAGFVMTIYSDNVTAIRTFKRA